MLNRLLLEINTQLDSQQLKVSKAALAIVDASIIESPARRLKKELEIDADQVIATPPSKDDEAQWVKKAGRFYLGYKLHVCNDAQGDGQFGKNSAV